MALTYIAISKATVGAAGASSISFTSIPSTYTDLLIKASLRSDKTDGNDSHDLILSINSSTANLSFISIRGDGASVYSNTVTDRILRGIVPSNYTANIFSNIDIYIPNYLSNLNKSFAVDTSVENNAVRGDLGYVAARWSQTSAISSLTLTPNGPSSPLFVQYSTATLYGIKNS